jgi:hypothetical protein
MSYTHEKGLNEQVKQLNSTNTRLSVLRLIKSQNMVFIMGARGIVVS